MSSSASNSAFMKVALKSCKKYYSEVNLRCQANIIGNLLERIFEIGPLDQEGRANNAH